MAKTNSIIPVITVPQDMITTETHEKYGESFKVGNNAVMFNGVLCKLYTFNTFEKTVFNGREVNIKVVNMSFKPVKAEEPKSVPRETKAEPKSFKTSEVAKTVSPSALEARVAGLETGLSQILALLQPKAG